VVSQSSRDGKKGDPESETAGYGIDIIRGNYKMKSVNNVEQGHIPISSSQECLTPLESPSDENINLNCANV